MVLKTDSMPVEAKVEEKRDGEMRRDAEGKGYWYSFKKGKKAEKKAEEVAKEKVVEASAEEVVVEKPVKREKPKR